MWSISLKPIKVYKVVEVRNKEVYAPYRYDSYDITLAQLEGAYLRDRRIFRWPLYDDIHDSFEVEEGMFHFALTKEIAYEIRKLLRSQRASGKFIIIECQGPPLTRYYVGSDKTSLAAKRFRVTKILQD